KELTVTLTLEEYNHLLKEKEALLYKVDTLGREKDLLRWRLENLLRRLWGKSSEKRKLPEDPAQLSICFDSPTDVSDPVAEETKVLKKAEKQEGDYNRYRKSFTKKVTPHARKPIDPSLPREEIVVPMPDDINLEGAVKMGEEVTEQYAVRPAQVYVIRT
ncbi:IS66 family transposase, partial [Bacteroides sp. 224]|nr:IS66 family transposase [Bacteroides sp. 224]